MGGYVGKKGSVKLGAGRKLGGWFSNPIGKRRPSGNLTISEKKGKIDGDKKGEGVEKRVEQIR